MSNHNYALSTRHNIGGCLFRLETDAEYVLRREQWLRDDIRQGWSNPEHVRASRRVLRKARQHFMARRAA